MFNKNFLKIIIKNSEIFSGISDNIIEELIKIIKIQEYKKNEIIVNENDEIKGFYIIARGKVQIYKMSYQGKKQIIKIAEESEVCGEAVLFATDYFPVLIETIENSIILFIPKLSFINILKNNFELSLSFITILSKRLQYLLRLVESISLKDVAARLCEYLISEIKKKKNKIENGDVITIKIKNYALADYLGTIPETLSRISKKLEEKNIIKKEKNKIIILNKEQFIKIAKGKIKEI
ncbi:MAG TPA: Crp/Fnr family transcriptional regulator [bacterium]|nr:Crp/Fnr family transcriptional regulator [bacterium]HPQ18879.1 Crp/Fnr family transcriptional regulator [bacterium]